MFPGVGQLVLTGGKLFGTELPGEKSVPLDDQPAGRNHSHTRPICSVSGSSCFVQVSIWPTGFL